MLEQPQEATTTGHKLLDACLDVLEGRAGEEKLVEAISIARHDLTETQQDFQETVAEHSTKIQQECQKDIDLVYQSFQVYFESLEEVEKYFTTHEKFDIVRGAEKIRASSAALNGAFLGFRNNVLIALGPTDIPIVNLVLDAYTALIEAPNEEIPERAEHLLAIIQREYIIMGRAAAELQRPNLLPEEESLKRYYEEHQSACLAIKDSIQDLQRQNLDWAIERYKSISMQLKEIFPAVNLKRMTQMPTPSPQANLVINIAKTLKLGKADEEMFLDALKSLEEYFNKMKMQFESVRRNPVDSMVVKEEIAKAQVIVENYENAINDFFRFVEVREILLLDQAITNLGEAATELHKCSEIFHSIAEREGKTPCIRCSHYNPSDRKTCERCGAVLPVSAESQAARTFEFDEQGEGEIKPKDEEIVLTDNIYKLFEAVNQVAEGQISVQDFEATVGWMEQIVADGRKAYGPVPSINLDTLKPEQRDEVVKTKEMVEEAKEVFREATDDLNTGLGFFRNYIQQGDKNNLIAGVQLIWQGVGKLQKVDKVTGVLKKAQDESQKQ